MSNQLYEKAGEFKPDNLIVSTKIALLTRGVKLANNQGLLTRGSLIGKAESGLYHLVGATVEGKKIEPTGVLTDDVNTDQETEPIITTQYITGEFNKKALIVASGASVEDYEENLRTLGIFMEETI